MLKRKKNPFYYADIPCPICGGQLRCKAGDCGCLECGWWNDHVQERFQDLDCGENALSFNQARRRVAEGGLVNEAFVEENKYIKEEAYRIKGWKDPKKPPIRKGYEPPKSFYEENGLSPDTSMEELMDWTLKKLAEKYDKKE